ncbi:LysR family transcriptional regulator [Salipiger sp.]|uniref:LysR family transcriptional regulator n=1 Tax=Salipiger sp. TaxID=2078585 RepID=UPI003A968EA8
MDKDITSNLKVRHLSLIVALADHGTTHRAAGVLNMTQSTASKMLRDVEELFQATLFEREPRGMKPTPLGQFVIDNARGQLSRLLHFSDEFHARRTGGYGTLTIGVISGAAPGLVAHALAEIKRMRPLLMVVVHGETSDTILDMLENGRLDLAVGRFSTDRHRHLFDFEPIAEEELVIVARAGHPLAGQRPAGLAELADCPWVLQPRATPSRRALDAAFGEAGLRAPVDKIECSSILAMMTLVEVSDAIALLPASVVDVHLRAGVFTVLPVRPKITLDRFGLITRKREALSDAAVEFSGCLRRNAALYPR